MVTLTVAVDGVGDAVDAGGVAHDLLPTVVVASQRFFLSFREVGAHGAVVLLEAAFGRV